MSKIDNLTDVKTIDDLGQFVGLKEGEGSSILAEVRSNHAKLATCTRHQFRLGANMGTTFAKRFHCVNCGGTMRGEQIHYYAEGVKHAGEPRDVWVK